MKLENGEGGTWKYSNKMFIIPPEGEVSYIKDVFTGKVLGFSDDEMALDKHVVLLDESDPLGERQKWLRGPLGCPKISNLRYSYGSKHIHIH